MGSYRNVYGSGMENQIEKKMEGEMQIGSM